MKTKILFLSILVLIVSVSFAQKKEKEPKKEKDKVLVNKAYSVYFNETGTKKTGKPVEDEIGFKGGKLNSKFITTELHFPAPAYTVTVDSSASPVEISFESSIKNTDEDEIKIEGTVTDGSIEGTAVVTSKKGKIKNQYAFSGDQKEKGPKKK